MKKKQLKAPSRERGQHIATPETLAIFDDRPAFALRYHNTDYSLSLCTKDETAAFAETLHRLSQMRWLEIQSAGKHGLGCEKIS